MNELTILTKSFDKIKKYLESNKDTSLPIVKFKTASELEDKNELVAS